MDKPADDVLNLGDVLAIAQRRFLAVAFLFILCGTCGYLALKYLPKSYKSTSVLTVQSSYFRNPLVSDLISEVTDPGELNAQRISLLRLALDEQFLDNLGEKYSIYRHPEFSVKRISEREALLKLIEYFNLNPTTFKISVSASEPGQAYEMMKEILDKMTYTLTEERYKTLVKAKEAIQIQANFLSRLLKNASQPSDVEFLQTELAKVDSTIETLRSKFTESHPEIYRLRQQADIMRSKLKRSPSKGDVPSSPDTQSIAEAVGSKSSKESLEGIYNELLKKLSYLSIILNMEKDRKSVSYLAIIEQPSLPIRPFTPNIRGIILVAGVMWLGLSILYILATELKRSSILTPYLLADLFDAPLLGELPVLIERRPQLLLEHKYGTNKNEV